MQTCKHLIQKNYGTNLEQILYKFETREFLHDKKFNIQIFIRNFS